MTRFDRKIYFDSVRASLFDNSLSQQQVDGQEFVLDAWEKYAGDDDVRWLAYFLATAMHETAQAMWPIEEYGHGDGQPYGVPDPQTGQAYYGRGFVQLTWKENYQRADGELPLTGKDSCVWNAAKQLDPTISARTGYLGMVEAWFRFPNNLEMYFSDSVDDPYGAREIINGDKTYVPSWSNGVPIGNLLADYHADFLAALKQATIAAPTPARDVPTVTISVLADGPVNIVIDAQENVVMVADSANRKGKSRKRRGR
jgi:hypothetical protein